MLLFTLCCVLPAIGLEKTLSTEELSRNVSLRILQVFKHPTCLTEDIRGSHISDACMCVCRQANKE